MRCSNCGTEFADGSAQCPVCGAMAYAQQPYGGQPQQNVQQPYGGQYQQNAQQPYGGQPQQNMQQPYGGQYQQNAQQPYGGQYQQNVQQPYGGQPQQNMQQPYGGQYQQNMQQPYGGQSQQAGTPAFGMGWFKFTIYVQLFLNALLMLINGVSYLTGSGYGEYKDTVYLLYPSLKAVDICLGIVSILFAVYAIFTRMQLAKFKKNGPLFLYILLGGHIALGILSNVITILIVGSGGVSAYNMGRIFGQVTGVVILLVIDIIYFQKRKSLFVN